MLPLAEVIGVLPPDIIKACYTDQEIEKAGGDRVTILAKAERALPPDKLDKLFKKGLSARKIGEKYGLPMWSVYKLKRKYWPDRPAEKKAHEILSREKLEQMILEGYTGLQIAKKFGLLEHNVKDLKRRYKLTGTGIIKKGVVEVEINKAYGAEARLVESKEPVEQTARETNSQDAGADNNLSKEPAPVETGTKITIKEAIDLRNEIDSEINCIRNIKTSMLTPKVEALLDKQFAEFENLFTQIEDKFQTMEIELENEV